MVTIGINSHHFQLPPCGLVCICGWGWSFAFGCVGVLGFAVPLVPFGAALPLICRA